MTYVCPADHKHGVTGTCYVSHKCRCGPCVEAVRAYNRRLYQAGGRVKKAVSAMRACQRCPQRFRPSWGSQTRLCRDCRSVLSGEEKEIWAS